MVVLKIVLIKTIDNKKKVKKGGGCFFFFLKVFCFVFFKILFECFVAFYVQGIYTVRY